MPDSADNPTGGGVGDRADVLRALLARSCQGALIAGITDRSAVEACFAAGEGASIALRLGGSLDPASVPADVMATVIRLDDQASAAERQALVRVADIEIVLSARRRPYHNIQDFRGWGLIRRLCGSWWLSPAICRRNWRRSPIRT